MNKICCKNCICFKKKFAFLCLFCYNYNKFKPKKDNRFENSWLNKYQENIGAKVDIKEIKDLPDKLYPKNFNLMKMYEDKIREIIRDEIKNYIDDIIKYLERE